MWISQLKMNNIRSFAEFDYTFSNGIYLFVGKNNSGKSTILRALYTIQDSDTIKGDDSRKLTKNGFIQVVVENISHFVHAPGSQVNGLKITQNYSDTQRVGPKVTDKDNPGHSLAATPFKNSEPDNIIYPLFSKRKNKTYAQSINDNSTKIISGDFTNIVSIINSIIGTDLPIRNEFIESFKNIFEYEIATFSYGNGMDAGLAVTRFDNIILENMGEGVAQILGLLAILCRAEDKIIMIEEPENDLHPGALKKLLEKIIDKATTNQFFITTHSNIVAKYLGKSKDIKIFHIKNEIKERIPLSTVDEVKSNEDKIRLLEDLGYELQDFDIWDGWLFLEESTAERMICEYFIPLYAPKLKNKVKTVSCMGNSHVENRFEAFYSNFLYTHLTPVYENKAWAIIDGDEKGKVIVDALRAKYKKWKPEHFDYFIKDAFEFYYPEIFQDEVKRVLAIKDFKSSCDEKTNLLVKVLEWSESNKDEAKKHFDFVAIDVIEKLQMIEKSLFG